MTDKLFIQATVDSDLDQEAGADLKQELAEKLSAHPKISSPRVMVKKTTDTITLGFSVKTNLQELANNPANGRYLGLMIFDGEGELVSEKFILNPAIKHQRGRFSLVLDILAQNDVDRMLLSQSPDDEQSDLLAQKNFSYEVVSNSQLTALRESPPV